MRCMIAVTMIFLTGAAYADDSLHLVAAGLQSLRVDSCAVGTIEAFDALVMAADTNPERRAGRMLMWAGWNSGCWSVVRADPTEGLRETAQEMVSRLSISRRKRVGGTPDSRY